MAAMAYTLAGVAIVSGVAMVGMVNNSPGFGALVGGLFVAGAVFFLAGTLWNLAERFGAAAGGPNPAQKGADAPRDEP